MNPRILKRILIVEDNESLLRTLRHALEPHCTEVGACRTVAEACTQLADSPPDLVLLDVVLPDGNALDVLRALAGVEPAPIVVALSGEATPDQAFELAQYGVRAYLAKPVNLRELTDTVRNAVSTAPDLTPHLRQVLGHAPLHAVEGSLRSTLVDEALARSNGSLRGAARLLGISRQLLQYILRGR